MPALDWLPEPGCRFTRFAAVLTAMEFWVSASYGLYMELT